MTSQVLEQIKQAESEVEALLAKARQTKEATVTKARKDALTHLRKVEEDGRAAYEHALAQARATVAAQTAKLGAAADQDVEALKRNFESRLAEARARIQATFERAVDAQD